MTTEGKEQGAKKTGKGGGSRKRAATGASGTRGGQGKSGKGGSKRRREVAAEEPTPQQPLSPPRLLQRFRDEIAPALIKEFEYSSPMRVPRLTKIILNIGLGEEASRNPKAVESATQDLTLISGQHPMTTRARQSIAGFKIREGMPMGVAVTLRSRRMYEFFDRLVSSSLPRIRDFRGLSRRAFDGRGNYAIGIREQIIFPEIDYNSIDRMRGMQVVIVTSARTDDEGLRLLELLGVPFVRDESALTAA